LRRVGEEVSQRLATIPEVSRAYTVGGEPRTVRVDLSPDRLEAYHLSPLEVRRALAASNVTLPGGEFTRNDAAVRVDAGRGISRAEQLPYLVVGVFDNRPVFLKDMANVHDGPAEVDNYVRHGWGPARGFAAGAGSTGTLVGERVSPTRQRGEASPAVTVALAKKKGTNAVALAETVLRHAEQLRREKVIPDNIELVVTRNYGLTADDKVNELIEALGVAILIVLALLTLALGWRAALVVAIAIPVVFGLTLAVNLLCGYTINRVTLFALIVALGLLVDDPIVDVENITRHFEFRKTASPDVVVEAVAEIRPPLISATLAVIVSFLPLFFITGMMGPYMAPMALNVPVSMLMSMLVAFTITPWLSYHLLKRNARHAAPGTQESAPNPEEGEAYDPGALKKTLLYRFFRPLMAPLLSSRFRAILFLLVIGVLTVAAVGLAATRSVPLKMLPYDNKNELVLVLDMDKGTTLERTDAVVREFERFLAAVPDVTDYTSYVGVPGPMDFNGLVRHYYLRQAPYLAEVRLDLGAKKHRGQQSHGLGLRLRNDLTALADRHGARLKIVEVPPGPPVLSSVVAEIYGRPDQGYDDLLAAAATVNGRMKAEPGLADVDDSLVSHPGFPQDMKLLGEVPGIDVCLSGHTHNRLYRPALQGKTLVIQSGCHGSFLGRLDVEVQDGKVVGHRHQLLEVAADVRPDPEVGELVRKVLAPYRKELAEPVGETRTALNRFTALEATADNFLLHALREHTGAQLAFANGWRFGAPVVPGPVVLNDLFNLVPMNPPVSTVELTGEELTRMLEENLERTFSGDAFHQMGGYVKRGLGLTVHVKIENPPGQRIQKLFVGDEEVRPGRVYRAAFVTEQGVPREYGRNRKELPEHAVEVLRAYLKRHGPVEAPLRGTFLAE
jgi:preprotein translocase subunit SecF